MRSRFTSLWDLPSFDKFLVSQEKRGTSQGKEEQSRKAEEHRIEKQEEQDKDCRFERVLSFLHFSFGFFLCLCCSLWILSSLLISYETDLAFEFLLKASSCWFKNAKILDVWEFVPLFFPKVPQMNHSYQKLSKESVVILKLCLVKIMPWRKIGTRVWVTDLICLRRSSLTHSTGSLRQTFHEHLILAYQIVVGHP